MPYSKRQIAKSRTPFDCAIIGCPHKEHVSCDIGFCAVHCKDHMVPNRAGAL